MEPVLMWLACLARMSNRCLDLWLPFYDNNIHRLILEMLTLRLPVTRQ